MLFVLLIVLSISSSSATSVIKIPFTTKEGTHVNSKHKKNMLHLSYKSHLEKISLNECKAPQCKLTSVTTHHGITKMSFKLNAPFDYSLQNNPSNLNHKISITINNKPKPQKKFVVLIDPGHGGKDPGAISSHGVKEKDITLAISKKLAAHLNKYNNISAHLTRYKDTSLSLRSRLNASKKYHADLFISIHADAFVNKKAKGISVYALSEKGASSASASWLASHENKSFTMEIGDIKVKDKNLQNILFDLSQKATNKASIDIGEKVLKQLEGFSKLHSHRVEQAAFVVLKSAYTPAILIETGFLSNPQETQCLQSPEYQDDLAKTISKSIHQFSISSKKTSKAPPKTYSSVKPKENRMISHTIQPNETLYSISRKYHANISTIVSMNKIKHGKIISGQKIKVLPNEHN